MVIGAVVSESRRFVVVIVVVSGSDDVFLKGSQKNLIILI